MVNSLPTVTHSLVGGMIGFLFYIQSNYSKDSKYTKKHFGNAHLIILALNAFIGPDLGKIGLAIGTITESPLGYSIVFGINNWIHNIFGWFVFAIPLAFLYYAIFNGFKGQRKQIRLKSIYILMMGAGLLHFAMDTLDSNVRLFPNSPIFPDYHLGIEMLKTGYTIVDGPLAAIFPWFSMSELLLMGIFFLIVLIWALYNKSLKVVMIIAGIFVSLIIGIAFLFGSQVYQNENDLGFFIYAAIFWFIPLALCMLSYDFKYRVNENIEN